MKLRETNIIHKIADMVRAHLEGAEGGHDWWHVIRVWQNAKMIAKQEKVDRLVVELAALLHDIADPKFHDGDEEIGPTLAKDFLTPYNLEPECIKHILNIIRYISFKNTFGSKLFTSKELEVVQDADRLDAIGAIGIARAFHYGGFKNREIYNPGVEPRKHQSKEAYKKNDAPTINHFYEKLLLLKDQMNTPAGIRMALERHNFLETYLEQFYKEWNSKA